MYLETRIPSALLPPLRSAGVRTLGFLGAANGRLGVVGVTSVAGEPTMPRLVNPAALAAAQAAAQAQADAYQKAVTIPQIKILRNYLVKGDYLGAWSYAASHGDPTKPQGRGTNAYGLYGAAVNFNILIALLETSAGINLLKVPAFTLQQMKDFYAAAAQYWDGNILGVNPYPGTEWGDPGSLPGDAVINFQTPNDNLYPDLARFGGRHPDPSFFSRWGVLIITVVAAIVTYGASLAATAGTAASEAAAAEAAVGAGGLAAGTAAGDVIAAEAAAQIAAIDVGATIGAGTAATAAASAAAGSIAAAGTLDAITVTAGAGAAAGSALSTLIAPTIVAAGIGASAVAAQAAVPDTTGSTAQQPTVPADIATMPDTVTVVGQPIAPTGVSIPAIVGTSTGAGLVASTVFQPPDLSNQPPVQLPDTSGTQTGVGTTTTPSGPVASGSALSAIGTGAGAVTAVGRAIQTFTTHPVSGQPIPNPPNQAGVSLTGSTFGVPNMAWLALAAFGALYMLSGSKKGS